MSTNAVVFIEAGMVVVAVIAFYFWQMRDLKRAEEKERRETEQSGKGNTD